MPIGNRPRDAKGRLIISVTSEERFWPRVSKTPTCWLWQGGKSPKGYGKFWIANKDIRAHRQAWVFTHGPIPIGLVVCHRCDIPSCVNPEHLFLGTQDDNVRDCVIKGRQARGETQSASKLTAEQVLAIRAIEGVSQRELARRFGVTHALIGYVQRRAIWRHI